MSAPGILITRYHYEEPYHLHLGIDVSNGRQSGSLEFYCNADDLGVLGRKLCGLFGRSKDEVIYELGSERPADRFAFFLGLRVRALDAAGHCVLHVRLNNNQPFPDNALTDFCIRADIADVNRLGSLLEEFGNLRHRSLDWRVQDGQLTRDDEETTCQASFDRGKTNAYE